MDYDVRQEVKVWRYRLQDPESTENDRNVHFGLSFTGVPKSNSVNHLISYSRSIHDNSKPYSFSKICQVFIRSGDATIFLDSWLMQLNTPAQLQNKQAYKWPNNVFFYCPLASELQGDSQWAHYSRAAFWRQIGLWWLNNYWIGSERRLAVSWFGNDSRIINAVMNKSLKVSFLQKDTMTQESPCSHL